MSRPRDGRYLSNASISRRCKVKPSTITRMTASGRLVKTEKGYDIENARNKMYLADHNADLSDLSVKENKKPESAKKSTAGKPGKSKAVVKYDPADNDNDSENENKELTAGNITFNGGYLELKEIEDLKWKQQRTLKLKIENAKAKGELIPRFMVQGILGQIDQATHNNFVDMPRRESEVMAAKLGIPDKTGELERLWSKLNEIALENVKSEIIRLQQDEIYE